MPTLDERKAFAQRLKAALRRSPEPVTGPTELALRFNLRYEGRSVSAQTVHNWLAGRTIPSEDKLVVLAEWLKVDKHWLHYGPSPGRNVTSPRVESRETSALTSDALDLASRIQELPSHWRYLVEELVDKLHKEFQ